MVTPFGKPTPDHRGAEALRRCAIYGSHDAATAAIGDYIDDFYNSRRRHSCLGYASLIELELKYQPAALAA